MPTNPFFSNASTEDQNEKDLYDDLTIEAIQIAGTSFLYMPKTLVALDPLFGEDPSMQFDKAIEIEMFIENSAEYQGEGRLMKQFGLEVRKKLVVNIAIRRFQESFGVERPHEGDWVWHPATRDLMQVQFVDDEPQLYGTGSQNFFRVTLESVEYSHEPISTGYETIDDIALDFLNDGSDSNGLVNDLDADNEAIKDIAADVVDESEESPFGRF